MKNKSFTKEYRSFAKVNNTPHAPEGVFSREEKGELYSMKKHLRGYLAMFFAMVSIMFASAVKAQTPTREAYVERSADSTTLTFYYDAERTSRSGKTFEINDAKKETSTKEVIIDASFRDYRPTSTSGWFLNLEELTQIEGLENLNTEKVTEMNLMFYGCTSLTTIDLSHFNTEKVTDMSSMFNGCESLKSIDLSHFNTQNLTNMYRMFYKCTNSTTINLSHFNTQNVTDMSSMFNGCKSLKSIDLSHFNTQNVTDMSSMFYGCESLKSIDLSNLNLQNVTDMHYMFSDCTNMETINLSNSNLQSVTEMSNMFSNCTNLKSVNLSNLNLQNVTEMSNMFYNCTSLTTLDLNSFDTQHMMGMSRMFYNCRNLTTINCTKTWNKVDSEEMFKNCKKLKGAANYDATKTDAAMANPETGYFTGKTTAVNSVRQGEFGAQSIYTLQGKRVKGAWQHLPAGVYVVNGKKVIK